MWKEEEEEVQYMKLDVKGGMGKTAVNDELRRMCKEEEEELQ